MRTHSSSLIVALGLVLFTAGYGLFEARTLIIGPVLELHYPSPGETLTSTLMEVRGNATNVTRVSINGHLVTLDLSGNFHETLLTPNGYGTIVIDAENRFGRKVSKRIDFLGTPPTTTDTSNS